MKKGMTSTEFIKRMEDAKAEPFGDRDVVGLDANEFEKQVLTSKKVSNFVRNLRKEGVTEFGTGWATRILMQIQKDMGQTGMMLQALVGGLQKSEVEKINEAQKERATKALGYIG